MSDINLLPEDLREREQDLRARKEDREKPKYSNPSPQGREVPDPLAPPSSSRWQQLVSALKQNLEHPEATPKSAGIETKPVVTPPPTSKPVSDNFMVENRPPTPPLTPPTSIPPIPPRIIKPGVKLGDSNERTPEDRSLRVNLIPLGERSEHSTRIVVVLLVTLAVSAVVVFGGYIFLKSYVGGKITESEQLRKEVDDLQALLDTEQTQIETVMTLRDRLGVAAQLLDEKSTWSGIFKLLEANTVPTVSFMSFAGDEQGKLTLSGMAPNYTEVARQLKSFQTAEGIVSVELAGLKQEKVTSSSSAVSFSMNITVDPVLFVVKNIQ